LESGSQLDTVYFDISKAFDIMDHQILLKELKIQGIPHQWLKFLADYMRKRRFGIRINGHTSTDDVVPTAGVAQGSATGPFLFTVLIDPLQLEILYAKLLQFADDSKVFKQVDSIQDAELLQIDINRILQWFANHGLRVNTSKTKVVIYTRRTKPIKFIYRDLEGK
jgi:hypothetical protein